jgi:hypothetical protein
MKCYSEGVEFIPGKMVLRLALIPAFSPQEKEKRSPPF